MEEIPSSPPPLAGRPELALPPEIPVYYLPTAPIQDVYLPSRPQRRLRLPLVLFAITCVTTFCAGVYHWDGEVLSWSGLTRQLPERWGAGLQYMLAVMGILLAHEMGHFVMALRYRIPASLPFFIPMPFMLTGTMGAVIGMQGSRADRKQMFDIGIAGPLAGLILTIPILIVGILTAQTRAVIVDSHTIHFSDPLLVKIFTRWLRPDILPGHELLSPLYMAGWVGLLITGLNMLPISQLDGGHVIHGLFGARSKYFARAFLLSVIAYMVLYDDFFWVVMLMVVIFIGVDHPPSRDDTVPLGPARMILGFASLVIPILCFMPTVFY